MTRYCKKEQYWKVFKEKKKRFDLIRSDYNNLSKCMRNFPMEAKTKGHSDWLFNSSLSIEHTSNYQRSESNQISFVYFS